MRHSQVNSSDHKQQLQDECCDLYGEYCYPCNSNTASATRREGDKKQEKGKKRRAD